jgi:riboflavin kinase/FMN adenylyltransferase
VGTTLVLSFDRELALSTAEEFVGRVCVGGLGARRLLFGFDSAFGHERRGTFEHVSAHARELGIEVRQAPVERIGSERVSSTVVRQAILEGDLSALERYLGRRFSVVGKVVHGDGRGRTLGFPTANIDVEGAALPPAGVYFARISRLDEGACGIATLGSRSPGAEGSPESWTVEEPDAVRSGDRGEWGAVVNIGKRPTFLDATPGGVVETMEAHLPDFHGDLYGACLEVQLLARHRPERKFESAEALVREIRADIEAFRKYEAIRRPPPNS